MSIISDNYLDEIIENELSKLPINKPSEISGGLSQQDKDNYIESLLKEISDLKRQLQLTSTDINSNDLEVLDINVDETEGLITLKPAAEEECEDDDVKFDSNNILQMLGAFMNNGSQFNENSDTPAAAFGPENPMLQMLSKMMEGLGENMQSMDNSEDTPDSNSDEDSNYIHEKAKTD
jgi:hypothetical protein